MLPPSHCIHGRNRVGVIRSRNNHSVDLLLHLIEHHTKIPKPLGLWMGPKRFFTPFEVNITERHDILLGTLFNVP